MLNNHRKNKMVYWIEDKKAKFNAFIEKAKRPFKMALVLFGLTLGIIYAVKTVDWFNHHLVEWVNPLRWPVVITEINKKKMNEPEKKKAVEYEHLANNKAGDIDLKVLTPGQIAFEAYKTAKFKESSNGKKVGLNSHCLEMDMINEIGYDPAHSFCFTDRDEQVATAINWFRNCLATKNINECLKVYSNNSYSEIYYE